MPAFHLFDYLKVMLKLVHWFLGFSLFLAKFIGKS